MAEAGVEASLLRTNLDDQACSRPWLELTVVEVDLASEEQGLRLEVRDEEGRT